MISSYYYSLYSGNSLGRKDWVERNFNLIDTNRRQYFIGKELVVDSFDRFQSFADDINVLKGLIPGLFGLGEVFFSIDAKKRIRPSTSSDSSALFNSAPDLIGAITKQCAFEINQFGYSAHSVGT